MSDSTEVQCPWCWERVTLYIDPETQGEFVEDCEVCCRPLGGTRLPGYG